MEKEQLKQNLKNTSMWLRIFFMILFTVFYAAAISVFWVVVVFQVLHGLIAGHPNDRVVSFSSALTAYLYQVLNYLTVQTEQKPFPFDEWPERTIQELDVPAPVKKADEAKADDSSNEGDNQG